MIVTVVATLLIGGIWISLRERREVDALVRFCMNEADSTASVAQVLRAVRALKLITCEIDSRVHVERGDENWRGVVRAAVTTPVRMRYGVNLDQLDSTTLSFSPYFDGGGGVVVLRVPYPELISTEIFSDREKIEVEAEGLRLRRIGGEYYLGLARRDVAEAARNMKLLPEDEARVRDITVERLKELVGKILGDQAQVLVRFEEAPT